jgi:hypothetical protein
VSTTDRTGADRPRTLHLVDNEGIGVAVELRAVESGPIRVSRGDGAVTTLRAIEGGMSSAVLLWESDIERRLAAFIADHLKRHPSPGPSQVERDLRAWGPALLADALSRVTGSGGTA